MQYAIDFTVQIDDPAFALAGFTSMGDYLTKIAAEGGLVDINDMEYLHRIDYDGVVYYDCSMVSPDITLRRLVDRLFESYERPALGVSLTHFGSSPAVEADTKAPVVAEPPLVPFSPGEPVYDCTVHFKSPLPQTTIIDLISGALGDADFRLNSNGPVLNEWIVRFEVSDLLDTGDPAYKTPEKVAGTLIWLALTGGKEEAFVDYSNISTNAVLVAG